MPNTAAMSPTSVSSPSSSGIPVDSLACPSSPCSSCSPLFSPLFAASSTPSAASLALTSRPSTTPLPAAQKLFSSESTFWFGVDLLIFLALLVLRLIAVARNLISESFPQAEQQKVFPQPPNVEKTRTVTHPATTTGDMEPACRSPVATSALHGVGFIESALNIGRFPYKWTNWAKIHTAVPNYIHFPRTESELVAIIRYAAARGDTVKCIGAAYSPNDIGAPAASTISRCHALDLAKHFNRILSIDAKRKQFTVQSGASLRSCNAALADSGLAFHCLCSVDAPTIGGLLATGAHGTGSNCGVFAASVVSLRLLAADSSIYECSATSNSALFHAARCHLGGLGVVLTVTLQCVAAHSLRCEAQPMHIADLLASREAFDAVVSGSEHTRLKYFPGAERVVVERIDHATNTDAESFANAQSWSAVGLASRVASALLPLWLYVSLGHWMNWLIGNAHRRAIECALVVCAVRPALVRPFNSLVFALSHLWPTVHVDRSDRIFHFDCLFAQFVSEWAVPYDRSLDAIHALKALLHDHDFAAHFPIEFRFARADDIWLSAAYGQRVMYINIIMYRPFFRTFPRTFEYFQRFESAMSTLGGRPHWAKWMGEECTVEKLRRSFPRYDEWRQMKKKLDPKGLFENEWLQRYFPAH